MKIHQSFNRRAHEEGSALGIVMFFAIIIGIPLMVAFLPISHNQYRSVARSQNWNANIPVGESGVEEALAHLNRNCYSNVVNNGVVKWNADGWTATSNGVAAPRRYLDANSNIWYEVRLITNSPTASMRRPEIVCVSQTPALFGKKRSPLFAQVAQAKTEETIARQVRVATRIKSRFALAVGAVEDITGNGQFELDAYDVYDSAVTPYTGGEYDEDYRMDVAVIGSIGGNIDLGAQGVVYGEAYTGPDGTVEDGVVGSIGWIEGGNTTYEPGTVHDDLNETMDPIDLPPQFKFAPSLVLYNPPTNITYTNFPLAKTEITSPDYPNPAPVSGVTTNSDGALVDWTTTPPPPGATDVETRYVTNIVSDYNLLPNPKPTDWGTNNAETWIQIGTVGNDTTPATLPSDLTIYQALKTNTVNVLEFLWPKDSGVPAGLYRGTVTNLSALDNKDANYKAKETVKGEEFNWYRYVRITSYEGKVKESYWWSELQYRYKVKTSYTYLIAETNAVLETAAFIYAPGSGYYKVSGDLDMKSGDKMLIRGNTRIYVTGEASLMGEIIILPGGSLQLYLGGDAKISGNGVINNNIDALSFQVWGLEGCENFDISGNGELTGTIYVPNAVVNLNGGGSGEMDIKGSINAKEFTANGHFKVHYQAHLARTGPASGYVASGWLEEKVGTGP